MVVAKQNVLEELVGYLDFTPEDARLLEELAPLVRERFHPIVERFYEAIENNPGASAVITGGPAQIERLKGTLRDWLEGVVGGVYDEAYLERRSRIGRMHVKIGLDQRYMFSAMNILREGLHDALDDALDEGQASWSRQRARAAHRAIDKICDMELAIMLETYREDYATRIRDSERLATLGQFAASIGHELRNPLAVVETSLHLLKNKVAEDPKVGRHISRIEEQITLCGTIIGDLLEMARDREPSREPTDIVDLVKNAAQGLPQKGGVAFRVDLPESLPPADVDPLQLRQVVVNLMMNASQAVTSAREGGRVLARVRGDNGTLRLRVEDDGPGLPEEIKARLFEPLFTTRSKGIGLGLALCRRIVEKHGGEITGENRRGGGAVFEVVLPDVLQEPS